MTDANKKSGFLGKLRDWLDGDKTEPAIDELEGDRVSYVRAWLLLRKIEFKRLWLVFFSVPVLVFFAVSGFIAWCVVFIRFILNLWAVFS